MATPISSARKFEDAPAVRGPTPLLFGLIGPSGAGKTFSALRLATGMQRVFGGEIFMIDTESNRSLHYAERFKFRHVPFAPPFSPLDYLAALEHCIKKGAKTIIVDSMSHEHEGPGGVLEMHAAEVNRIMTAWSCREDKANIPAWAKPKAARRRLINSILQMQSNFIFCFRAKDKIKVAKGSVSQMGFMPIAGEEFVYELTAKALLLPGANGVPTWKSENEGERMMIKLPEQFRGIFTGESARQLDEDIGEQLATWAAGGAGADLITEYSNCQDAVTFRRLEARRAEIWQGLSAIDKKSVKAASEVTAARLKESPAAAITTESAPPADMDEDTGEIVIRDPDDIAVDFDIAASEKRMRAAKTKEKLEAEWAKVVAAYKDPQHVPLELDAAYTEMNEAFKE